MNTHRTPAQSDVFDLSLNLVSALRDGVGIGAACADLGDVLGSHRVEFLHRYGDARLPGTFSLACALLEDCGSLFALEELERLEVYWLQDALANHEFTAWLYSHCQLQAIFDEELGGVGAVEDGGACPATPSDEWVRARLAMAAFLRGVLLELGDFMEPEVLPESDRQPPAASGPASFHTVVKDASALLMEQRGRPVVPNPVEVATRGPAWTREAIADCARMAASRRHIQARIREWMTSRLGHARDRVIVSPEHILEWSWTLRHDISRQHELLTVVLSAYPRDEQVWARMHFAASRRNA